MTYGDGSMDGKTPGRLRRRLMAGVIVGFWLVMMGLLAYRELGARRLAGGLDAGGIMSLPSDTWLGVYLPGDVPAGYINIRSNPGMRHGRPGSRVQANAQFSLALFGRRTVVSLLAAAWVSEPEGLVDASLRMHSGSTDGGEGHDIQVEVQREEGGEDGAEALAVRIVTGGEVIPMRFPATEGTLALLGGIGTRMDIPRLKPGQETEIETLDPFTMAPAKARVKCVGRESLEVAGERVDAQVVTVSSTQMNAKAWVDDAGDVLRLDTPLGISLKKVTAQEALALASMGAGDESLLELSAIRPSGMAVTRGIGRLEARIAGVDEDTSIPSDDTQRWTEDGRIVVVRPEAPEGAGPAPLDADAEAGLGEDMLVQSGHPAIRACAEAIVAGAADGWAQVERLYDWVHGSLEKTPVVSIPSALEVLQTLEGDCNEHTVLFVALARAAGIPSRIALGVVWSEELGGFYYHAWPEAYVDGGDGRGRWYWVDPTLGQLVADATHIKLLTGGIERWTQLTPFIGRLQVEIVVAQ